MRLTKPNPQSTIQVTVRDQDLNTSKTKTFYDTSIDQVLEVLETYAAEYEKRAAGKRLDVSA